MKRILAFNIIILFIVILNVIFDYYKTEKVLLVGELIGFEIPVVEQQEINQKVIPTSYNTLGTMSFIKEDSLEFFALGHSTAENINDENVEYECFTINNPIINKSTESSIGAIIGKFNKDEKIGLIKKDTNLGIYGTIENIQNIEYQEIETASRYKVKNGNANILINIDGSGLKSYEVEINEINYSDESMNIRVEIKDNSLIEKTGGIIQGMSGTPLIQDGKLVGIINYVENNNSKVAYAVFVDKLI